MSLPVPLEFLLFGATLLGVALSHGRALEVALSGLAAIILYKLLFTGFDGVAGLAGLFNHLAGEWAVLANLLGILTGFALLSRHFELSRLPSRLPDFLPAGWPGGLVLLAYVYLLSGFLDNIAAALIGATVAIAVYRGKVHISYVAALVAAANAGGAGSVIGDTTTTMMWIAGVGPAVVFRAYVATLAAFLVFAVVSSRIQQRHSPILVDDVEHAPVDWNRVAVVGVIMGAAILANLLGSLPFAGAARSLPLIGLGVWIALLSTARWRRPDWSALRQSARGAAFLLSLVAAASMMPVDRLPGASAGSTLILGFVSAAFDNIPLTALALEQGGYDWGLLAYCVGFGGSMLWFGSSAGVAVTNLFPECRDAGRWLRHGWSIVLSYLIGFAVFVLLLGWNPGVLR